MTSSSFQRWVSSLEVKEKLMLATGPTVAGQVLLCMILRPNTVAVITTESLQLLHGSTYR